MQNVSHTPLWIDSDSALGAPRGDIDAALAMTAFFRSGHPIQAISAVYGSAGEPESYRNHLRLASLCGYKGRILRGAGSAFNNNSEAAVTLAGCRRAIRIVALGAVTNIAQALKSSAKLSGYVEELVISDAHLRRDPRGLRRVLDADLPITIIPYDIARTFKVRREHLDMLPEALGAYLSQQSRRRFLRARLLKFSSTLIGADLVTALYVIEPRLFDVTTALLRMTSKGELRYDEGDGAREVQVVVGFEPFQLWAKFFSLFEAVRATSISGAVNDSPMGSATL